MTGAPIGADVGLYYDARTDVAPGDFIRTGSGRTYLIRAARRQERGRHVGRWHVRAVVVEESTPEPGDVVHHLRWYRRG